MTQRSRTAKPNVPQAPARPGEVRIIAGQWKRSRLKVLPRPGLRPTPDRVRETVFNWLGSGLSGWRVLDAFAGSGALGLEAASRGAEQVVMLESDSAAVRELRAAHQRLGLLASVHIEQADALQWMQRSAPQRFELAFIDPPFASQQAAQAAALAARLLVPGGLLVVESPQPVDPPAAQAVLRKQLRAGAVLVELWQLGPG
jgi:16S rRNA (guanine966-N2)-methyltransferase